MPVPKAEIDEQARECERLPGTAEHTGGPPVSRGSDAPMSGVLHGVRVVEVAQWWFVPAAGAVLADWGADVGLSWEEIAAAKEAGAVS